eukprot:1472869-Rhodomonas_salina.1
MSFTAPPYPMPAPFSEIDRLTLRDRQTHTQRWTDAKRRKSADADRRTRGRRRGKEGGRGRGRPHSCCPQ